MRSIRSIPLALLVVLATMVIAPQTLASTERARTTFPLWAGDTAFWTSSPDGPDVPGAATDYRIVVKEPAATLRVALDQDRRYAEGVDVALFDPKGELFGTWYPIFTYEFVIDRPAPGTWVARVTRWDRTARRFRMRATLQRREPPGTGRALRLPNIRMVPPFQLTLEQQEVRPYPPAGFGGLHNGCFADEVAAYRATRCLRFSTGPGNVGAGDLKLRFEPSGAALSGLVTQEIDRADGTRTRRPAGAYEYHPAHAHFHHGGFGGFALYRVDDQERGLMTQVGVGPKLGFCMNDYILMRWRSFENGRHGAVGGNCGFVPGASDSPMSTGLTRGWGDVYAYYTEGMFVDLGDNPNGLYVVQVRANANDWIWESNYSDNYSYALVRVGGHVFAPILEVLERGYGRSPWDPKRALATDILRETTVWEEP